MMGQLLCLFADKYVARKLSARVSKYSVVNDVDGF